MGVFEITRSVRGSIMHGWPAGYGRVAIGAGGKRVI
jgi:hypothetical protein